MKRRIIFSSIVFCILTIVYCSPKAIERNILKVPVDSYVPSLRMPFNSGVIVLCAQGNLSPFGFSHSIDRINCSFSLDFLNPTIKDLKVVAAADGEVVDIFTTAVPDQDFFDGGWGWGNYAIIDHDHEYYTLYAHLDKVLVTTGQSVKSGETLGTVGKSGLAGGIDHLHFGLFQGTFNKHEGSNPPLLPMQIPIEYFLTLDLDKDENEFTYHKGLEIVGLPLLFGNIYASENEFSYHRGIEIVGLPLLFGNIYASENDVNRKPQSGKLPESTLDSLIEKRKSLIAYLKTDPFEILKMNGDKNVQKQIKLIKNKIKTIH